ncbi:ARM repeat-containing protein [Lophium mytilinum]|uniref:ARM repeat-containing protein n=1 Tax=Lophium mytilinum TaxID=390894 RepID=A0A6A6QGV0_9PEZI|nr:ARM repeat-containing protein [Lophium mytilinum]
MAFSTGLGDRQDDLRFRNPQSPRDDSSFPPITSPLRGVGSQLQGHNAQQVNDARATLHRRFTTNTVPTLQSTPLSPIGQQRRQAAEPAEFTTATYHKLQVIEKKKLEFEYLREQRRRFDAEMALYENRLNADSDEVTREMGRSSFSGQGHQSEPTTPPEFHDHGFPTQFSRPGSNRFSLNSTLNGALNGALNGFTAPTGMANRQSRSGSAQTTATSTSSLLPSKSMPGSRRNSDEENEDRYDHARYMSMMSPPPPRSSNVRDSLNRLSMPVTSQEQRGLQGNMQADLPGLNHVLGQVDTTNFLFRDEDGHDRNGLRSVTSPESTFLKQMDHDQTKFPVMLRGEHGKYALDLATSQQSSSDSRDNGWNAPSTTHRHHSQLSLPVNTFSRTTQPEEYELGNGAFGEVAQQTTPKKSVNRHSMESKFSPYSSTESQRSSFQSITTNGASTNGLPKLQASYSTNDIPTLKNGNGNNGLSNGSGAFNTHAEQHLHNHNASLGRLPNHRQSQDYGNGRVQEQELTLQSPYRQQPRSNLHASAAPFNAPITSSPSVSTMTTLNAITSPVSQYNTPSAYGGYGSYNNGSNGMPNGMNMLNMGFQGMQLGAPQMNYQPGMYQQGPYNQYGPGPQSYQHHYGPQGRFQDSQARVIQNRRMQNDQNRFAHLDLKTMSGHEIHQLCKDQHGCRFLQKQLEGKNPEHLEIIFRETNPFVIELMTDPFGNYLCQKLLEYTNDEQRTVLVKNAAPSIVQIALNQHGTRALQKMIEFISTREQIDVIIKHLSGRVVHLIQDLNGNHVIQKCLNHLKAADAQFIFDAVGEHCIIVGTHRHGCCVLQRCIDHASGLQKVKLVRQITANSIALVQDPFGNYVVQYILDLNEADFTQPLCLGFRGQVAPLSKQKFSSNVIEKCIRVADPETKRIMIDELLDPNELEKLLRDNFANYVVQTALEYAPHDQTIQLVDAIRPYLALIRQTPYGRRIQSKVQEREIALGRVSGHTSGQVSPHSIAASQSPPAFTGQHSAVSSYYSPPPMYATAGNAYGANIVSPQPHRLSNPPLPSHLQNTVHQGYYGSGQGSSSSQQSFF